MTNENIIKQLKRLIPSLQYADDVNAVKGAIQALSQEPCDDTVSIRKDVLKCRVGNIVAYNVEWLKKHWQMEMDIVCGVKPCDDAISRQTYAEWVDWLCRLRSEINSGMDMARVPQGHRDKYVDVLTEVIDKLPSVTQKSGKWIPVSERLPEDLEPVNITWVNHEPEPYYHDIKDRNFVATGIYYRGQWYWYSTTCADYLGEYGSNEIDKVDDAVEIIAWMPLPEPYEPQEGSGEE